MSNQHFTIALCVLVFVSVPLGSFVVYKAINKCTRAPINTVHRHGDIELQYIEPSRPNQIYNPLDLEDQFSYYDRISNFPPSYNSGLIPSYRSGTIPSYHSGNNFYINSCFENEGSIILWITLFLVITIFILFLINYIKN